MNTLTENPFKSFNPQTLSYSLGDSISWKDSEGSIQRGIVTNIHYSGLQVLNDLGKAWISWDHLVS